MLYLQLHVPAWPPGAHHMSAVMIMNHMFTLPEEKKNIQKQNHSVTRMVHLWMGRKVQTKSKQTLGSTLSVHSQLHSNVSLTVG